LACYLLSSLFGVKGCVVVLFSYDKTFFIYNHINTIAVWDNSMPLKTGAVNEK